LFFDFELPLLKVCKVTKTIAYVPNFWKTIFGDTPYIIGGRVVE
jgi:hypothetical protein